VEIGWLAENDQAVSAMEGDGTEKSIVGKGVLCGATTIGGVGKDVVGESNSVPE
jgi:hypothetical protein